MIPTLEQLLTDVRFFGLETASPVQRAVCRIVDGLPLAELAEADAVVAAVGNVAALPTTRPREVGVFSAIRTAKSLLAAADAVRLSQIVDVSGLGAGEVPRIPIVSLSLDLSRVVYQHLTGNLMSKRALRSLVIGEPTADAIMLRHPSGRPVEIKCVAGSRAGGSLVARWLGGVIFDEAPRMVGEEDGVVNLDEALSAVRGRLLPGGHVYLGGTPWANRGPVYELVQGYRGPSSDLVIVRAPGWAMNPSWWTPARVAEIKARDLRAYRADVCAEFVEGTNAAFREEDVLRAFRDPEDNLARGAPLLVVDPSSGKSDRFTWAIVRWTWRRRGEGPVMWAAWDRTTETWAHRLGPRSGVPPWQSFDERGCPVWSQVAPSDDEIDTSSATLVLEHLDHAEDFAGPTAIARVYDRAASTARRVGARRAVGDQRDELSTVAEFARRDVRYQAIPWTAPRKAQAMDLLRGWLRDDRIVLPNHDRLRRELLSYEEKILPSGVSTFAARGAGHDDFVSLLLTSAIAEAEGLIPRSPNRPSGPRRGTTYTGHRGV